MWRYRWLLADCFVGSRYIYDLYYEKEAISRQLYEWLLKNNYADANLIAKWKKQGYEKVLSQFLIRASICSCLEPCLSRSRLTVEDK
jgi:bud site selection protein 31